MIAAAQGGRQPPPAGTCVAADARHLRCGSRSREARTGVLLPTHRAMKLPDGWGTRREAPTGVLLPTHRAMKLPDGWGTRHLRCGRRSREARTGVLLPTYRAMKLPDGWGTRHLRCGRRSREAHTGVLLPTHRAMKLPDGWGTRHRRTASHPSGDEAARWMGHPASPREQVSESAQDPISNNCSFHP